MKSLAILVAGLAVVVAGSSLHASASGRVAAAQSISPVHSLQGLGHGIFGSSPFGPRIVPAQAAGTATPIPSDTPIPTNTATPTPAPTAPGYPDAQSVLSQAVTVLAAIRSVHFDEVATQDGAVQFHIEAIGDATCSPALIYKEIAKRSVPGTQQSSSHTFSVIHFKNKIFWKTKKTKNRWQTVKAATILNFGDGFVPDDFFPLICSGSSGTGTGTGSGSGTPNCPTDQLKDITNVGPDTLNGTPVWHLHLTDVVVDCQGNTTENPIDIYVTQTTHLLAKQVQSFADQSQGVTGAITTILTKFGEKVTIKAPKQGSSKP